MAKLNFRLEIPVTKYNDEPHVIQIICYMDTAKYPNAIIIGYDNGNEGALFDYDIKEIMAVANYWLNIPAITAPNTPRELSWNREYNELTIKADFETGHFVRKRGDLNNHEALFLGDENFGTGLAEIMVNGISTWNQELPINCVPSYIRFVYDEVETVKQPKKAYTAADITRLFTELNQRATLLETRLHKAGLVMTSHADIIQGGGA